MGENVHFRQSSLAAESLPEMGFSASKYPQLSENILNAQSAGYPEILTHGGDIEANRAAALDGIPNIRPLSRDEYPFASSMEGGGRFLGRARPGVSAKCTRSNYEELL